jgi:hypothetical protein
MSWKGGSVPFKGIISVYALKGLNGIKIIMKNDLSIVTDKTTLV